MPSITITLDAHTVLELAHDARTMVRQRRSYWTTSTGVFDGHAELLRKINAVEAMCDDIINAADAVASP